MHRVAVSLGTNLGDREGNLLATIAELSKHSQWQVTAVSDWFSTTPAGGPTGQEPFLNAAVTLETSLDPHEVLAALQAIESRLGRVRETRWGPRSIDLDLLLYDDAIVETEQLIVPHPRMAFRRFVLAPLVSIAKDWLHPTTGCTVGELLHRIDRRPIQIAIVGQGATEIAQSAAEQVSGCVTILGEREPGNVSLETHLVIVLDATMKMAVKMPKGIPILRMVDASQEQVVAEVVAATQAMLFENEPAR